ncbi:hypothetical protein VTO73DRAFT_10225 [Trametes versicolor]
MATDDLTALLSRLHVEEEELDEPDFEDTGSDDEDFYDDPAAPEVDSDGVRVAQCPHDSPYRLRTLNNWAFHAAQGSGSLVTSTRAILDYMRELKVDLPLLLWAISYNESALVDDPVAKFERTTLLSSREIPGLLKMWHRPPRGHSKGIRSKGAGAALDRFALDRVRAITKKEMGAVGTYMRTQPSDLSSESLLSLKIPEMQQSVKARAPILWSLLRQCAWTSKQERRNTKKDPEATILYTVSMLSFSRSNRNNPLQRLNAIYLKSCGTSAKAFDTLSAVGISMSQAWTYRALEQLSTSEHECLWKDLEVFPWFASHDNVNFKFRVFEQRSDHHSHFDSGTAGTIFVVKDPAAVAPNAETLRVHRETLAQSDPPKVIGPAEILALEADAAPRLATRAADKILQVLLGTPDFDLGSYAHREDSLLRPAPRPGQLHVGPDSESCAVRQYILDTVHMEEASYDGNDRVLHEWLRQLKMNSILEQKRTGTERVIPWVGDQLTASRLRGLLRFHQDDYNAFERLDWLVPTFGWFHLMFAFEQSLHTQYYGTRTGLGLVHSFDTMGRRGLHTTSTQGTFHHTFEEALDHTLQAHLRTLWCHVGKVETLAELRSRSPQELCNLATEIRDKYASTLALTRIDTTPAGLPQKALDPLSRQVTQFVRDTLDYVVLRDAISCGDVHTMEDSLPRLLFRFSGGSNPNYAIEVCELLQCLHADWPEDLKNFIRKHCWLTNTSGHQNSFIPIDRAQEHNVCAIKSTYAATGPFATWEYLGKTSASIPVQRLVKDHVERQINHGYRGKSHTSPLAEKDICKLHAAYKAAHIYGPQFSRRKLESQDRFVDVMKLGSEAVLSGKAFKGWSKGRLAQRRVVEEDWNEADAPGTVPTDV